MINSENKNNNDPFIYQNVEVNENSEQEIASRYTGKKYKCISNSKLTRLTCAGNSFLTTLAAAASVALQSLSKFVSNIFIMGKTALRFGVRHPAFYLTIPQQELYHQIRSRLDENSGLKHPYVSSSAISIKNFNKVCSLLCNEKLIAGYGEHRKGAKIKESLAVSEGWYDPEESVILNQLLDLTPIHLKNFLENNGYSIQDVYTSIFNNEWYKMYQTSFRDENDFISFAQNMAVAILIKDLSDEKFLKILEPFLGSISER